MARAAILALAVSAGVVSTDERAAAGATSEVQNPVRTAKERLVNKASDEQRVNNCKVPAPLRGPKPRPDACQAGTSTASSQ